MTYHDNTVSFSLSGSGYSLISGTYLVESFSVTNGQDPDKKIYAGLTNTFGSNGSMTFSVGRHGSADTANWFNNKIPTSQTTFNHKADDLNFAFLGKLTLTLTGGILGGGQDTFTFSNIGIAQGHTGSSNNWWFGGQNCSYIQSNQVICTGVNSRGSSVTFVFLRGGNDVSTIGVTPTSIVETTAWMGKISNTVALDQLVMPGSHDAGMSETNHCTIPFFSEGYVVAQAGSVGAQLANGSRYFDIRVDYDYDELVTYHRTDGGTGCNGQSLKSVLDQTVGFLTAHNTETAIIKISHIRSDRKQEADIKAKINSLLTASYSGAMYSNTNTNINLAKVSLGDVRGKMIIVFDYPDYINPSTGRFRYMDGFVGSNPCATQSSSNLTVCDKYSDTASYETMKTGQLSLWNSSAALGAGHLFLLSWTLTSTPPLDPTIEILATEANSKLPSVLYDQIKTQGKAKPNVVYIDFVDSPTAQSIKALRGNEWVN